MLASSESTRTIGMYGTLHINGQDWSLQCPSNATWLFKIYLSQNNPSKCNPKLKMKMSLTVLNRISPPQEPTKHRALSLQEVELDGWFSILHIILETCTIRFMHKFNMSFVFQFYNLGLTSWIWTNPSTEELNLRALQNKTHMRASILNTAWNALSTHLVNRPRAF